MGETDRVTPKYAVMKWDDWLDLESNLLHVRPEIILEDAEVIRHQDIFAGPGLHAYANVIQTGIDLLENFGYEVPKQLPEIRDHFMNAALTAEAYVNPKVPD